MILATAILLSEGLIVRRYVHDMFFVSDVIWRSQLGQTPHIDFESAIGQAFYWPYQVAAFFSEGSILDLLRANLIMGALLLALCLAALPSRFPPLLLFLATGLIVATGMTGRSVDALADPLTYDYLAPYNRWGWSFAMLAALIAAVPPSATARRSQTQVDALCLGLALIILFYMKLTVFVPSLGLAVLAVMLGQLRLRTFMLALACSAVVVIASELAFGNNLEYLGDIRRAAAANLSEGRGLFRVVRLAVSLAFGGVFGLAVLVILRLAGPALGLKAWLALWWRTIVMLAAIIAAAAMIRTQNHTQFELAMFGSALIAAAELGRRKLEELERSGNATYARPAWQRPLLFVILGAGVGLVPLLDATSIVAHAAESRMASNCSNPVLRGTPMERLIFPRENLLTASSSPGAGNCSSMIDPSGFGDEPPHSDAGEYRRLIRTTSLLRRHVRSGDVILAFEFSNPYPFVFRAPPPEGALIWWDLGRSYSTKIHPDPAKLLDDVDFVIQTDYPYEPPADLGSGPIARFRESLRSVADNALGPGQDAWLVYGKAVEQGFTPVGETGEVRVWQRKGASGGGASLGGSADAEQQALPPAPRR